MDERKPYVVFLFLKANKVGGLTGRIIVKHDVEVPVKEMRCCAPLYRISSLHAVFPNAFLRHIDTRPVPNLEALLRKNEVLGMLRADQQVSVKLREINKANERGIVV